ncbi:Cytochrome P450 4V2 [Holothuria leucospilota]|uniref:Cytochrome P450 4V2 n=1 Tax=Holothuria leucospilota TaxID=206669 RepID=A0A9Q1H876_HOLLE|nr:Cytochrome P450 4V2 [Holothuria leucospilota]
MVHWQRITVAYCVETSLSISDSSKVITTRKEEIQKLCNEECIINDVSLEARRHRKLALLDFLIQIQKNDSNFTDDEIQHEVDTFMFGVNDTTSTAVTFTLYLIGRHPKVQRKLQAELRRVFGKYDESHRSWSLVQAIFLRKRPIFQLRIGTDIFVMYAAFRTRAFFYLLLVGNSGSLKILKGKKCSFAGNDRERSVTSEDLQELEYMSCVIKESHRIFPPVPFIGREIEEDISICGSEVPKGVSVFLAVYILHRDPHYFPNPEKFDPDRFLPANSEGRHNCAFIPFSAGPRNCIGQKFATMEQKVLLATILRKLNITSLQTPEELDLTSEIVLRPRNAVNVKLNLRPSVTDEGV